MGIAGFVLVLGLFRVIYSIVFALVMFLIAKYKVLVKFIKLYGTDWGQAMKRLKYKYASSLVK